MPVIAGPDDFRPKHHEVQLPSQAGTGKAVLLRKPNIIDLIDQDGSVPDPLTEMMLSSISGRPQKEINLDAQRLPGLLKAVDRIAVACFVQPKLWYEDDGDDAHVPVAWVPLEDKMFVASWALGREYQPAAAFPESSDERLGTV